MRYIKLLLFMFALAIFLGGLALFFKHQHEATEIIVDIATPLAFAEDLAVNEFDEKNNCRFVLNAQQVTIPQSDGKSENQDMICHNATIVMTKDYTTTATLTVALAHINRENKTIACSQSVTGSMNGMTFLTSGCNYTFSTHCLEIPGMFELVSAEMRTIAPQASINTQTGTITCNKGIKTVLILPSQGSSRNHRRK